MVRKINYQMTVKDANNKVKQAETDLINIVLRMCEGETFSKITLIEISNKLLRARDELERIKEATP